MTNDLKPCPFCGGEATHNDGGNSSYGRLWWSVGCVDCGVMFSDAEVWDEGNPGHLDPRYQPKDCFDEWNTRVEPEQRPYTYIGKDGVAVLARDLEDERDRLRDALKNVLGHVNTPIGRRRLNIRDPHPEWLVEARAALEASK